MYKHLDFLFIYFLTKLNADLASFLTAKLGLSKEYNNCD